MWVKWGSFMYPDIWQCTIAIRNWQGVPDDVKDTRQAAEEGTGAGPPGH